MGQTRFLDRLLQFGVVVDETANVRLVGGGVYEIPRRGRRAVEVRLRVRHVGGTEARVVVLELDALVLDGEAKKFCAQNLTPGMMSELPDAGIYTPDDDAGASSPEDDAGSE